MMLLQISCFMNVERSREYTSKVKQSEAIKFHKVHLTNISPYDFYSFSRTYTLTTFWFLRGKRIKGATKISEIFKKVNLTFPSFQPSNLLISHSTILYFICTINFINFSSSHITWYVHFLCVCCFCPTLWAY